MGIIKDGFKPVKRIPKAVLTAILSMAMIAAVFAVPSNVMANSGTVSEILIDQAVSMPMDAAVTELGGVEDQNTQDTLKIKVYQDYTMAYEVLDIVNAERQKAGAEPLVMDESLLDSAMHRSAETVVLMSHGRPDGTLCFTINDHMFAENYAWGANTAQEVMDMWMKSDGHRANILNKDYTGAGIGCIKYNGAYHWVQCFGSTEQTEDCEQPKDGSRVRAINMPYNTFTDPYKGITVTFNFSIAPSGKTMIIGETRDLTLMMGSVKFLDGENSVYWRSSDESIASVDANGVVTGLSSGTTVITASSRYLDRYSHSLTVTVVPKNMRVYGDSRVETSIEAAKKVRSKLGVNKLDTVIVACGSGYADALSGNWLSAVKSAPVILLDNKSEDKVASFVKNIIANEGTVYILGGTGVVPKSFEAKLSGLNVKRLDGESRFDTNMAILKETDTSGQDLLVCSGYGYPDALSVSSVGKPIMLVGSELTDDQKEYLETTDIGKIYVIGGTGVVSKSMADSLKEYASVTRVGGANRFETSLKSAKTFFPGQHDYLMMVYAMDFPDGLSGGALAYLYDAPVILATTSNVSSATSYRTSNGSARSITMGGPTLISDNAIFTAMGNTTAIQVN